MNKVFTQKELNDLEQRYRVTLINSLAGFKQAVLIGTKSPEGHTNLALFNSLIHIGSNPALYGFICRPDTVQRDTLSNILATNEFTLNYIKTSDLEKAHQTSARYETGVSEFAEVGFTEQFSDASSAPFVQEAVVKIAMTFADKVPISLNGTLLIIGRIQQIDVDDSVVGDDGFVDLEQADVLACSGLDAYYSTQLLGRLTYAKPDKWPVSL
ncbi:flavin reductase family protein [Spirosoma spitsbergense]|uniref:flavin reductase family protein n=1 Tax=Spirosoma spitsbergense TaxID=431554 RepID=UPI00037D5A29|nr:flavin reductase [Spirosoma spitsbergense]